MRLVSNCDSMSSLTQRLDFAPKLGLQYCASPIGASCCKLCLVELGVRQDCFRFLLTVRAATSRGSFSLDVCYRYGILYEQENKQYPIFSDLGNDCLTFLCRFIAKPFLQPRNDDDDHGNGNKGVSRQ